ncbi:hypothetical protein GCM10010954_10490 [Halobacillus andaensis]|uniref:Uncharacterized protein n=1 Tax=Halobacillus andaensis TaxID=1176239 RepID=A0A917B144_HALAA|nr:hypothetical protein GCM10010954_10490 [Halobacillus andaensis]
MVRREGELEVPLEPFLGDRTESIVLLEEEMIECGTNGGMVLAGVNGKILALHPQGLKERQPWPLGNPIV